MLQELKKSAGTEAICRSNENVQAVEVQSLTSINPAPELVSLQKKSRVDNRQLSGNSGLWVLHMPPCGLERYALCGVTTPDLPPLEHENVHYADAAEMEIAALRQRIAELESRTVKLPPCVDDLHGIGMVMSADAVVEALTSYGIKVEAE
ncbi:ead/Ea22-like family protein [Klebsiella pneumoniae]